MHCKFSKLTECRYSSLLAFYTCDKLSPVGNAQRGTATSRSRSPRADCLPRKSRLLTKYLEPNNEDLTKRRCEHPLTRDIQSDRSRAARSRKERATLHVVCDQRAQGEPSEIHVLRTGYMLALQGTSSSGAYSAHYASLRIHSFLGSVVCYCTEELRVSPWNFMHSRPDTCLPCTGSSGARQRKGIVPPTVTHFLLP